MDADAPTDTRELRNEREAAEREAGPLVAGLSEERGTGRPQAGSWSVAECLDHVATGNRVYLRSSSSCRDEAGKVGSPECRV